ncbi:MAG: putative Ig domain-containing protein, partial [Chloroflexota bacterium]
PSPQSGWQYLWNDSGPIGTASNYSALAWNGTLYDSDGQPGVPDATNMAWGTLSATGGHPGPGTSQGQATDRYAVAAYTVSADGQYSITDSFIQDVNTNCGNAGQLQVYVNDTLISNQTYPLAGTISFDGALGQLTSGDTIYIAAGPNSIDGCDGFALDFSIAHEIPANQAPVITPLVDQTNQEGDIISLAVVATDPDNDLITFSATNLPTGLTIDTDTGLIVGTLPTGSANSYQVTVTATDGAESSDTSFTWVVDEPLTLEALISPPSVVDTAINYTVNFNGGTNPRFKWLFGDNTPETSYSSSPSIDHTFTAPGRYLIRLTATDDTGVELTVDFLQAVHEPTTAQRPAASMSVLYEARTGNDRVWNVNPDNNSVTVIDTVAGNKVAEIAVGTNPRSLALAPDGRVWVVNKDDATLSIISADTLAVVQTINLPYASQPFGLVFDSAGNHAYLVLEAEGVLIRLNPATGAQTGSLNVGSKPRHISINGDGSNLYISRFISPKLPGEDTANPQTNVSGVNHGGEVLVVDTASLSIDQIIVLQHSDNEDLERTGRGIPNYLGPAVVAPDGLSAWVPSKQDNILRGGLRDGLPLDHDHTVRSITSRIALGTHTEDYPGRIDHDDGGIAVTALFGPYGNYLFSALEGSREIAVIDPYGGSELFRFAAGRAPQGLALSEDGLTLYVHNFMDRTVTAHDLTNLINAGETDVSTTATHSTVANEQLAADVLLGKQLFYDSKDTRLASDEYISCAACHNAGADDGRTWDFTSFGEGLRNTITLEGRAGVGHGPLHWSANFDEVQDFEGQIRGLGLGTGLMSDADFHAGTRSEPLGDPKAGFSADLDALAAYLGSLDTFANSPHRQTDGSLTSQGVAGQTIFQTNGCAQCHVGNNFTDSGSNLGHDIGTLKPSSGQRLGGSLTGIDTPTLRGVWSTAPYLHDGSADTLGDAVNAHNGISLTTSDLNQLVSYLSQLDGLETAPNQSPVITPIAAQTDAEGDTVNLSIIATDADGDTLTYAASGLPSDLTLNSDTGVIAGTLGFDTAGLYNVVITVNDGVVDATASFNWVINNQNQSPVITPIAAQTHAEDDTVNLSIIATDADGDSLTYAASGLPSDLTLNSDTGVIAGTLGFDSAGLYTVIITVNDGVVDATASFNWVINDQNRSPVLTTPADQNNDTGDTVSLSIQASDPDNDALSYSATNLPDGLSIESDTGLIAGTLSNDSGGDHLVNLSVSDGSDSDTTTFTWAVNDSPRLRLESIVVNDVDSSGWTTVNLSNSYDSMVAVCTPIYSNNSVPLVVRMQNATGNSLQLRLQNPGGATLSDET